MSTVYLLFQWPSDNPDGRLGIHPVGTSLLWRVWPTPLRRSARARLATDEALSLFQSDVRALVAGHVPLSAHGHSEPLYRAISAAGVSELLHAHDAECVAQADRLGNVQILAQPRRAALTYLGLPSDYSFERDGQVASTPEVYLQHLPEYPGRLLGGTLSLNFTPTPAGSEEEPESMPLRHSTGHVYRPFAGAPYLYALTSMHGGEWERIKLLCGSARALAQAHRLASQALTLAERMARAGTAPNAPAQAGALGYLIPLHEEFAAAFHALSTGVQRWRFTPHPAHMARVEANQYIRSWSKRHALALAGVRTAGTTRAARMGALEGEAPSGRLYAQDALAALQACEGALIQQGVAEVTALLATLAEPAPVPRSDVQ